MSPLITGEDDVTAGAFAAAGAGADFGTSDFCVGASAFGAGTAGDAPSSLRIRLPSDNLSPGLVFSSLMMPATGDGTSIVASSHSTVISQSSFATASPGLTSTSFT